MGDWLIYLWSYLMIMDNSSLRYNNLLRLSNFYYRGTEIIVSCCIL